jgi:hypothetical protein
MTMRDNIPITAGRPDKFTPERRSAIVDAIAHRIPYEYAAMANGIAEKTLYTWLEVAKHHLEEGIESDYTQFLQDIKRAEMTRIREHSDMIAAKPERWQADAWMLERRWHKHYGPSAPLNELNHKLDRLNEGVLNEKVSHPKRNEEDGKED